MRTDGEIAREVLRRAEALRVAARRRRNLAYRVLAAAACLTLIICLSFALSAMTPGGSGAHAPHWQSSQDLAVLHGSPEAPGGQADQGAPDGQADQGAPGGQAMQAGQNGQDGQGSQDRQGDPEAPDGNGSPSSGWQGTASATLLLGGGPGGYALIGVIGFALGAAAALLCARPRGGGR
jgi:hypothetical protein